MSLFDVFSFAIWPPLYISTIHILLAQYLPMLKLLDISFKPVDFDLELLEAVDLELEVIDLELKDINLVFDYHLMDKLLAEPLEEIVFNINDL